MKCENCGENEANVKYKEFINGRKREMNLCTKCSETLGVANFNFNIPINFSSYLGEFLDNYESNLHPNITLPKETKCDICDLTYSDFINSGKFGCANCYNTFKNKIDSILKNLQGANIHTGRKVLNSKNGKIKKANIIEEIGQYNQDVENNIKNSDTNSKEYKLENLKLDLKKAIKDERYEDAAKLRDEIKKIER